MQIPPFILRAARENKTSLGDQKAFPPDEEENFITKVVEDRFAELSEKVDTGDPSELKHELIQYIKRGQQIEGRNRKALEKLCSIRLTRLFDIPKNTVDLSMALVNKVPDDKMNLLPEKTKDYSFDSIGDMYALTDEIYKRRMLNCLIIGAAMDYAGDIEDYVSDLFKINPELPSIYQRIFTTNAYLMFLEKESLDPGNKEMVDGGSVDVYLGGQDEQVRIEAKGLMMPVLLEEGIKGLLELAIAHGLPADKKKAEYVIKKSDFRLAKLWDQRLGVPLWRLIKHAFKRAGYNPAEVGLSYIFMEIATMVPEDFNEFLQEIFGKTKKGVNMAYLMARDITEKREEDEFNDYMREKNTGRYPLTDDENYFSPDELDDEEADEEAPVGNPQDDYTYYIER